MKSSITAQRFIVNGENCSYKNLLYNFHEAFENKKPAIEAGKFLLSIASVIDRFFSKERRLNKQVVESLLSESFYSNEKIKTVTGHQFYNLNETIIYISEKYKEFLSNK